MNKSIRTTSALLLLAAAASIDETAAITAHPSWTAASSSSSLIQSQTATTNIDVDVDTIGELCVDEDGNLFAPVVSSSFSKKDLLSLRGGSLCVDKDGNFYSPRLADPQEHSSVMRGGCDGGRGDEKNNSILKTTKNKNKTARQGQDQDTKELCAKSSATAAMATGGYIKNDRLGGLSTDEDGNLYSSAASSALLTLLPRGGALCVDQDGNLYSPRLADPQEHAVMRGGCGNGGRRVDDETIKNNKTTRRRQNDVSALSSSTTAVASLLTLPRGGALSVDTEGNLFSPRSTSSQPPVLFVSTTRYLQYHREGEDSRRPTQSSTTAGAKKTGQ